MLDKAKTKHPYHAFLQRDISNLGIVGGGGYASFDTVLCLFSGISYCSDLPGVFRTLDKLLKPQGRFLFLALTDRYETRKSYILNQTGVHVPFYTWTKHEWQQNAASAGFETRFRGFGYTQDFIPQRTPQPVFDAVLSLEATLLSQRFPFSATQLIVEGNRI
jgi:SAM-dependent methyltransferase